MTVPALWASSDYLQSGIEQASISIVPDAVPGWSVNLATEQAHGAGASWTAASGEAASVAALYSLRDPSQLSVSYDVTGPIDGPSAGGLLTVGTLALLRGDKLEPSVTMTGTIAVGGRIGPVGGVEAKARAAADAGFTTMLVPVGLTPQSIPPGLRVIEVADLADAYEHMTGVPLVASEEPPAIAAAVVSEGRRQARSLANVDDMGAARSVIFEQASREAASWTLERTTQEARTLGEDTRAFVTKVTAEAADASVAGTMSAGAVASIAPILAPLLLDTVRAVAQTEWANAHPTDAFGTRAAALQVARARTSLDCLTPALVSVARATPGPPLAHLDHLESSLNAYSSFQMKAAQASKSYIKDSSHVTAADVSEDAQLASLAYAISSLTKRVPGEQRPGLAGSLEEQVYALAAWQATEEGELAVQGQGPSQDPSRASTLLLIEAARAASSVGRDASMALWMESWAADDADALGVHLGALATAASLAAIPKG